MGYCPPFPLRFPRRSRSTPDFRSHRPSPCRRPMCPLLSRVTTPPLEPIPPELVFVLTVAETSVPPQDRPVAVSNPVELTVIICVSFEAQVTSLVMSLVTGGWIYVPSARSCTCSPAS